MPAGIVQVLRLWTLSNGTICLLVEHDEAPRFEICVMSGEDVIRQNRLFARGSAQMLAETWRSTLEAVLVPRPGFANHDSAIA